MKREEILKWARAEARSIIGLINEAPYHSTHEHTAIIAAAIVEILEADRAEREAAIPGLKGLIEGTHVVAGNSVASVRLSVLNELADTFAARAEAHNQASRLLLEKALLIERKTGTTPRKKYDAKAREEQFAKRDRIIERELRAMVAAAEEGHE